MTTPQAEIAELEAENTSIAVKVNAVGFAGSLIGVFLAQKHGKNFWGKAGYFLAGGALARVPMALIYTSKLAANLTRIDQLKKENNL